MSIDLCTFNLFSQNDAILEKMDIRVIRFEQLLEHDLCSISCLCFIPIQRWYRHVILGSFSGSGSCSSI